MRLGSLLLSRLQASDMKTAVIVIFFFLFSSTFVAAQPDPNQTHFDSTITYYVYNPSGDRFTVPGTASASDIIACGCNPGDPYMFFVHGWMENCVDPQWVPDYVKHMREARGGCIICLDYRIYSTQGYGILLYWYFNNLWLSLALMLKRMNDGGFLYAQGYLFGFSFGGQMVLSASRYQGYQVYPQIDVCEKAGPGFIASQLPNPRECAQNVQCIHTSSDLGQLDRNCHQDWSMGLCGYYQWAAGPYPKGSHGLCMWFWNYSFNTTFRATSNPYPGSCIPWPSASYTPGYKMGYDPNKNSSVLGELFCNTATTIPYTV